MHAFVWFNVLKQKNINQTWAYQRLYLFILCLGFFFSACWVWQMESGSKWHSYKATPGGLGWSLLHLWPSRPSVCVCVCACPTASTSVGTPWLVRAMVPNRILCEMRQKKQENTSAWRCKVRKKDPGSWGNISCLDCQILLYFESFIFPPF